MTAAPQNHRPDPFAGYFASIALALVTSGWAAGLLVSMISKLDGIRDISASRVDIGAGIFLGIAFSNIVGVVFYRQPAWRALIRFAIGLVLGISIQVIVFTPLAGHGMSNFLFLLLAGGVVPLALTLDQINGFLRQRGFNPTRALLRGALKTLQLPHKVVSIMLMALALAGFWNFTQTPHQVVYALLGFLLFLTLIVSRRASNDALADCPRQAERRAWLELEPEEICEPTAGEELRARLGHAVTSLLPGAVLFSGMIMLAVHYITTMYPELPMLVAQPMASLETLGLVAASGIGVVVFGMIAALGLALTLLQIIARLRNWTVVRLRDNCLFLIRLMYFRPLKHKTDQP